MAYCTYEDVEDRLGTDPLAGLADHDGDGVADAAVVQAAIDSACALIDSHLAVRYAVPLDPVPDAVSTCAVNLAVYFLRLGRDSMTPEVKDRCEADVEWLRRVASGRASVGQTPPPEESEGAPGVRYEGTDRMFGRDEPL